MTNDVREDAPPEVASSPRRRQIELAALVGLLALGALIRAHGFTNLDLWFDDAWAAMPARVGFSKAVHMVLTAPGYGLALRSWIRLDPVTTWWAQLPAFVLGVLAIPAVYATVRWFKNPRWIAFGAALVVTVSPVVVQYSTRVKEYPFDLLAACALLVLAERVRRRPAWGSVVTLAIASVVGIFVSAGCAPVVVGAWLVVTIALVGDRSTRGPLLAGLAITVAGAAAVWAVFLRHLPGVLSTNWRRRGFLVDYRSLPRFERSVSLIFGGFVHAVFAYPVPVTFFRGATGVHAVGAAIAGVLVFAVAISVPVAASIRRREVAATLAAAAALVVALALAALDRVPLGDGRTDEALYPALLLCLAAGVVAAAPIARRVLPDRAVRRAVAGALAIVLVAGAAVFGVDHRAVYPTISLRGIAQRLAPLVHPGQLVAVDTFNSFGWCYYELSACRVQVGGTPPWPQGFRPVSTDPTYFIPTHYGIPLPEFTAAQSQASGIWYVGYTLGTYDVGASPAHYNVPVESWLTGLLKRDGWRQAPYSRTTVILGVHSYAVLYVRATS